MLLAFSMVLFSMTHEPTRRDAHRLFARAAAGAARAIDEIADQRQIVDVVELVAFQFVGLFSLELRNMPMPPFIEVMRRCSIIPTGRPEPRSSRRCCRSNEIREGDLIGNGVTAGRADRRIPPSRRPRSRCPLSGHPRQAVDVATDNCRTGVVLKMVARSDSPHSRHRPRRSRSSPQRRIAAREGIAALEQHALAAAECENPEPC